MATRINVTRASLPPFEEYIQEIAPLWNSHWLTNMGEKHQQLEARLAQYLQVPQVSLFSNGHLALELMLQAFHLKGEVITTPFSFASTTHAIVRNGLTPVFADVDPNDCTLDPACVEAAITPNTCAILPVHVYGNPCHVEELQAIADAHGLKLLYDSAHAFGVTYKGRGIAEYGDASMFSFHATKVFNTIEGGAVTCKDPALYHSLYQLKNFGIADAEHVNAVGANSKMNEVQAAMGLCNLRHLDESLASRKAALERYLDHLTGVPGVKILLRREEDIRPNYAYLPVAFDPEQFGHDRDEVYAALAQHNIFARKYFYPLISDYACYCEQYDSSATPNAKRLAAQVLTLPLFEGLEPGQVDEICRIILNMK